MIKVLIVDDEEAARELLAIELSELAKDIAVVERCSSFESAMKALQAHEVDIAFIDIQMPKGNGLDLLRSFPKRSFYPVMVTSHAEYAIEAIREEAFDYLLKPVDKSELKACLNRYRVHAADSVSKSLFVSNSLKSRIEVKDRTASVFIPEEDILFLEASGSYTTIHTAEDKYVESQNLKSVSSRLTESYFFRCSNQHVVNLRKVTQVNREEHTAQLTSGQSVGVSTRKMSGFIDALRRV